jgi:biopolymer transport protein TolR
MAFSGGGPSNPQINVTPLIDVLLVLIIILMVVNASLHREGLNAEIPQQTTQTAAAEPPDTRTIVIQLVWTTKDQPPKLKINETDVAWDDLQPRLHDIFKQRAERVAFVRGDGDVDFDYVAQVISTAREAGVDRVGLLTQP